MAYLSDYELYDGESRYSIWSQEFKKVSLRLGQIETLVQGHALGVQRVYDEMVEIKKLLEMPRIQELIRLLKDNDPEIINKRIGRAVEKLDTTKAKQALEAFEECKRMIAQIHDKLSY